MYITKSYLETQFKNYDTTVVDYKINKEAAERKAADEANATAISNEIEARKEADTTLQTNIDNETTERKSADETNANAISTETERAKAKEDELEASMNDTETETLDMSFVE